MKEMESNLEKVVSELANAIDKVEVKALEQLVRLAPLLEDSMGEIVPGIKGIALDEAAAWEYAKYRPILTRNGLFAQPLISRDKNGNIAYFLAEKEEWGDLAPTNAATIVMDFNVMDALWMLQQDIRDLVPAGAGAVEA